MTDSGNTGFCGNRSAAAGAGVFNGMVNKLLRGLCKATPGIDGYFAAVKREEVGGGGAVYGVAQCSLTVSKEGCGECLGLAYKNIESCPPVADGRGIDSGCFLRYSDNPFFRDNQTTDIGYLLRKGALSLSLSLFLACLVIIHIMALEHVKRLLYCTLALTSDPLLIKENQGVNQVVY